MLRIFSHNLALKGPCCLAAVSSKLLRGLHTSIPVREPREQIAGQPTHYSHPDVSMGLFFALPCCA